MILEYALRKQAEAEERLAAALDLVRRLESYGKEVDDAREALIPLLAAEDGDWETIAEGIAALSRRERADTARRCAEIARTPRDCGLVKPGAVYTVNHEKGCFQRPKTAEEIEAEIRREFPEALADKEGGGH